MSKAFPKPHICKGPSRGVICPFKAKILHANRKKCVFCGGVTAAARERMKRRLKKLGLTKKPRAGQTIKTR